jgi:PAS domain S-box-containing protein
LACAAFTVHDVRMIREAKVRQVTALAHILGSNATTAFEFEDPTTSEEILSSLRLQPSIEVAALFDMDGGLLASYPPQPFVDPDFENCPAEMDATFTDSGFLVIATDIHKDGDQVGTIYLRSNLKEIDEQLVQVAWIVLAVLTASFGVALFITGRLQRLFTAPIHELAAAMEKISAGGDSLHVQKYGLDEMGVLCDGFNTMLDRIAAAYDEIRSARDSLEQRVAQRTEELLGEVAERKQAEEALREAREFLETAMAQSPSGILIANAPDMTIRLANSAAFGILGGEEWETNQTDGTPNPARQLLSRAVLQGKLLSDKEFIIRDEDGRERWINASAAPIRDSKNQITAGIVIFNDITRQKQVGEELARARDAAQSADRSKSEFLANMSHEIRTPMTAILGFVDILIVNLTDDEEIEAAATIKRNGEYLIDIIDDILDISKIESGKMEIEQVECSPCQIISEVISLMRVRACARGLDLDVEYRGPIPRSIRSDPTRLRQILINLTGNAIKFTELGAIHVLVQVVGVDSDNPKIQIDVVDTGIGLTEQQMSRLFQAFVQADTSTTRKFGGTGLGLTISKRLAEMLGGTIAVESRLGQGSTFTVTVATGPLTGVTMVDQTSESEVPAEKFVKSADGDVRLDCRILLAEDGPDNQRLIAFIMRKAGAHITVVENGQLAVDAALQARDGKKPFDLILMDMQMPVLDGYGATRKLRQAGYTGAIIALTAHAMSGDRKKCIDAGCDE